MSEDAEAADEFRLESQKFRTDMADDQGGDAPADLTTSLKEELAKLSPAVCLMMNQKDSC